MNSFKTAQSSCPNPNPLFHRQSSVVKKKGLGTPQVLLALHQDTSLCRSSVVQHVAFLYCFLVDDHIPPCWLGMASITIWQWELLQGRAHMLAGWLYEACAQYVSNIMFKTKQTYFQKKIHWEPGWVGYFDRTTCICENLVCIFQQKTSETYLSLLI